MSFLAKICKFIAKLLHSLRDRSRVVPRSDSACVFTKRFLRSENAGFPTSRRVIARMMLGTPCWVSSERSRTAGAAAGNSGRVIFAACWAGMPIKAFAKIATPRGCADEGGSSSANDALRSSEHPMSIRDKLSRDTSRQCVNWSNLTSTPFTFTDAQEIASSRGPSSHCFVLAAISVMEMDEVLLARMASGPQS